MKKSHFAELDRQEITLTATEAAAQLGVSLKTVYNLCWSGLLIPASGTTLRDFRFTAEEIERRKRERLVNLDKSRAWNGAKPRFSVGDVA